MRGREGERENHALDQTGAAPSIFGQRVTMPITARRRRPGEVEEARVARRRGT